MVFSDYQISRLKFEISELTFEIARQIFFTVEHFELSEALLRILYVYQDPQNIGFCRKNDEKVVFSEDSAPLKNHFFGVEWPKNFRPAPNGVHKAQKIFFMVVAPFPHSVRIQDPKSGDFGRK